MCVGGRLLSVVRQHQRIGVADVWFRDHCDMRTANMGLEYLEAYRVSSNLIVHRCMQRTAEQRTPNASLRFFILLLRISPFLHHTKTCKKQARLEERQGRGMANLGGGEGETQNGIKRITEWKAK